MKKTIFLIALGMVVLLSGCTGANYSGYRSGALTGGLISTRAPAPISGKENRGVCLALSPRSSVNIDVECILEYVEGDANLDSLGRQQNLQNPWIRWHFSF